MEDEHDFLVGVIDKEYKDPKLRLDLEEVSLSPCREPDESEINRVAFEVTVKDHSAGFVLFDPWIAKWFHLEPKDAKSGKLKRIGGKDFEKVVLSLLKHRFPESWAKAVTA